LDSQGHNISQLIPCELVQLINNGDTASVRGDAPELGHFTSNSGGCTLPDASSGASSVTPTNRQAPNSWTFAGTAPRCFRRAALSSGSEDRRLRGRWSSSLLRGHTPIIPHP